jgi:heme/copper-type cytochrome/quinol oxidase subunit 2
MHGTVTVMNQSAYDDWMAERQGNVTAANTSTTSAGTNATATPAA